MSLFREVLGAAAATLAVAGSIYTLLAGLFVLRFFRTPRRGAAGADVFTGRVTVIKPLHGRDPGLRRNLETFFGQDIATPFEIVFGVRDASDPAIRIAEAVITDNAAQESRICLDPAEYGHNRKISNLINISEHATGDVLVLSDSDIGAPPDYLARVLGALARPGVGVVTCPYFGQGEGGFWADFSAMGISYNFLPNVIAGVCLGMAKPCMGSTVALRQETLDRIGGFQVFRDVLADDYAVGAAVRGLGLQSVVAPILVSHSCAEKDPVTVFSHELRWAKTVKGLDFAGHAGSVITHPLPLALLAAAFLGFSPGPTGLIAAALLARVWLMASIDRVIGRKLGRWWLIPARDIASFTVFVGSFLVRAVDWRGTKFHVTANGDLIPL